MSDDLALRREWQVLSIAGACVAGTGALTGMLPLCALGAGMAGVAGVARQPGGDNPGVPETAADYLRAEYDADRIDTLDYMLALDKLDDLDAPAHVAYGGGENCDCGSKACTLSRPAGLVGKTQDRPNEEVEQEQAWHDRRLWLVE